MKNRQYRPAAALAALLVMTAGSAAGAQECKPVGSPVTLPLVPSKDTPPPGGAYRVAVLIKGDPGTVGDPTGSGGKTPWHVLEVDTGSTGIVLPYQEVPLNAWRRSHKFGQILYTSDNAYHPGKFVSIPLGLGRQPDGRPAAGIAQIEVLAAQCSCNVVKAGKTGEPSPPPKERCEDYNGTLVPNKKLAASNCQEIKPGFGMMGVGYDRGVQTARNPFLRIEQMDGGKLTPGYVIATGEIKLGIGPDSFDGFAVAKLSQPAQPVDPAWPAPPADQPSPPDWAAPTGCVTLDKAPATYQVCGAMLPDTGIPYMMLTRTGKDGALPAAFLQPGAATSQSVPAGVQARVTIAPSGASSALTWTFKTGDTAGSAPAGAQPPTAVQWRGTKPVAAPDQPPLPPAEAGHINTGRLILTATDYAYDAGCGRVGFRQPPAKAGQ